MSFFCSVSVVVGGMQSCSYSSPLVNQPRIFLLRSTLSVFHSRCVSVGIGGMLSCGYSSSIRCQPRMLLSGSFAHVARLSARLSVCDYVAFLVLAPHLRLFHQFPSFWSVAATLGGSSSWLSSSPSAVRPTGPPGGHRCRFTAATPWSPVSCLCIGWSISVIAVKPTEQWTVSKRVGVQLQ